MIAKGMVRNEKSIEYVIEYSQPLEIQSFTNALTAFSSEYSKFVTENYEGKHPTDAKLYIEKIEEGSLITTLVEYATPFLPFVGDINTVFDFAGNLKNLFSFFLNKRNGERPNYDIKDLENLAAIVSPATQGENSVKIDIKGDNNAPIIVLNVKKEEALPLLHEIGEAKKELENPMQKKHTNVVFYWEQAKKNIKSKTGNFGVIEDISANRVAVSFDDDDIKKSMIGGKENPFNTTYIVDVEVGYARGKISAYKILKLHDIITEDNEEA